jgi:hypothetical protein
MRLKTFALALVVGLPIALHAQATDDTLSLAGRTSLMIGIGLTGARDATAGAGRASTHTTGEVGSFSFNRWVRPSVAVSISASVLNANTAAGGGYASTNAITPILFGLSYSPRALALTTSLRPYVSAAAGPYFHSMTNAGGGAASNMTETAPGARFGAGTNWFVARHFMLSFEADYHAVGKFDRVDAATTNASGFGMAFGFGFSWGGR